METADQLAAAEMLAGETAEEEPAVTGCVPGHRLGVEHSEGRWHLSRDLPRQSSIALELSWAG